MSTRKVIGISGLYHDSAAAALEGGEIKYAIQEERLSRVKHDSRFPIQAVTQILHACKWQLNDVDEIVFYEDPDLKLRRIWNQILDNWPRSWSLFSKHLPMFFRFKHPVEKILRNNLRYKGRFSVCEHHLSHAASTFYTSPFEEALVMTIDGVGESETLTVLEGKGNKLTKRLAIHFPDSLGLFYSVFTQYLGFRVNNGEYKVMGLAPYGEPKYLDKILKDVLILHEDGSFHLNQKYFDFCDSDRHFRSNLISYLGVPTRTHKDPTTQDHMDLAASVQKALEKALLNMLTVLKKKYNFTNLCMAGGVALNCTANAEIIRQLGINVFIHPAAGDAGGALGAAIQAQIPHLPDDKTHRFPFQPYLGFEHSSKKVNITLKANDVVGEQRDDIEVEIAKQLAEGHVVAILQGRDEWGPRALGNRSILASPLKAEMKDHLNAKIKFREEFRPFAPVVMEEYYAEYFETLDMENSPHMLFTHKVNKPDEIPAVVHVNKTGRVQTVNAQQNPRIHKIIDEFRKLTGVPVIINTSFNLRGEPIVGNPSDALNTFFNSGIDFLALEDYWVRKEDNLDFEWD